MTQPVNRATQLRLPLTISILVGLCYVPFNYHFRFFVQSDGPFHLAAIRNFRFAGEVVSPIVQLPAVADYHYNLSVALQALLYRISGDMHITVLLSGALFVTLFLISFSLLAVRYCRNGHEVLFSLLTLLFLSGPIGIIWAGAYPFSALMINGLYSQTFAYALFFTCLYYASGEILGAKDRWFIVLFLAATLIQHLLTGVVLLFSYYLLALHHYLAGRIVDWRGLLLPLPALLLYLVWPYYPTWALVAVLWPSASRFLPLLLLGLLLVFGGRAILRHSNAVQAFRVYLVLRHAGVSKILCYFILVPIAIIAITFAVYYRLNYYGLQAPHLKQLSPVVSLFLLALLPTLIYLCLERERDFIALWVPSLFALSFVGWVFDVPGYWRLLFFALIAAMIAVGRQLARISGGRQRFALLIAALAMVAMQVDFLASVGRFERYSEIEELAEFIPEGALVLADANNSYRLAGLIGRPVITSFASHWSGFITEAEIMKRREDVNSFFSVDVDQGARQKIIERYRPKYLLVAVDDYEFEGYRYHYSIAFAKELQRLAKLVIYRGRKYTLLKF